VGEDDRLLFEGRLPHQAFADAKLIGEVFALGVGHKCRPDEIIVFPHVQGAHLSFEALAQLLDNITGQGGNILLPRIRSLANLNLR